MAERIRADYLLRKDERVASGEQAPSELPPLSCDEYLPSRRSQMETPRERHRYRQAVPDRPLPSGAPERFRCQARRSECAATAAARCWSRASGGPQTTQAIFATMDRMSSGDFLPEG